MATKKPAADTTERQLLVETTNETLRITIPADAKLTFGPAFPGPVKDYGSPRAEYALRIYVGTKDNLLAVFTGVRQFREESIPVAKKITAEAGKTLWKSDENGYEVTNAVKHKSKFVDVKALTDGSDSTF